MKLIELLVKPQIDPKVTAALLRCYTAAVDNGEDEWTPKTEAEMKDYELACEHFDAGTMCLYDFRDDEGFYFLDNAHNHVEIGMTVIVCPYPFEHSYEAEFLDGEWGRKDEAQ